MSIKKGKDNGYSDSNSPRKNGSSFSYIAPIVAITVTNIYGIDDPVTRIRVAQGGIIMTGVVNVVVGVVIRYIGKEAIDKILPAEVTGSVATVIGIALAFVALDMASANWTVGLITLMVTILFSVYLRGRGLIGMLPILLGALVGYVVAIPLGWVDFQPIAESAWVRVPNFTLPIFTLGAILAIAPIAIATIPESTAHLYQISLYVDQLAAELKRPPVKLSRFLGLNLICDGVGEHPMVPTIPAIANAIYDAVGMRVGSPPFTAEKVYLAMVEAGLVA